MGIRRKDPAVSSETWIRAAGFAASAAIVLYCTARTLGFRLDDALIYARYARNFLAGAGLVYNRGEIHNAVTSPLFIWLLVGADRIGLEIPTTANIIGGLCTL